MRCLVSVIIFLLAINFCSSELIAATPSNPDSTFTVDTIIVRNVTFSGNKVTKDRIIQRELLFKENDTIPSSDLDEIIQQSRKNLLNTSFFNFVTIEATQVEGSENLVDISLDFIERWYIWPAPILEIADRNFNEWLKKKDWSRINYGMFLTWENFRGMGEKLILYARFGYDQTYQLAYIIPYINKKQTWGLGFAGGASLNHEIAYNSFEYVVVDSVSGKEILEGNKEFYYKDENLYPRKEYYAYAEAYYRKKIHNLQVFKFGYGRFDVVDEVLELNSDYSFETANRNEYLSFYYQFRMDHRDNKNYPLKGYYFDVELDKLGLGVFNDPAVNSLRLKTNIRKYSHLKENIYYSTGLTLKTAPFWDQPYYYIKGLGYGRDFVRGYEYYVVDGRHYGIWKNNLKFEIIKPQVETINFIPWEKFSKVHYALYLNVFADMGYVIDKRNNVYNPLANEVLLGYGFGFDIVAYYDFVLRVECSFNNQGDTGFYIHFMPSI